MGDKSSIEWTDATWNPIVGCSIVSKGCTNCYAMKTAGARTAHTAKYQGLTKPSNAGPVWTGEVRLWERALTDPLKWRNARRVFVNSMGDLFHQDVPDEWIDLCFAVMALCPAHTFQVLTKRPERMRAYFVKLATDDRVLDGLGRWHGAAAPYFGESVSDERWEWALDSDIPLPNVWLGVSCEDQATADERIPLLLQTPAALRFISAEPLLGPIDLRDITAPAGLGVDHRDALYCDVEPEDDGDWQGAVLDWVIAGGESGPRARPMHPAWVRSLRDQCAAAGVPFFFKQWGEWAPSAMFATDYASVRVSVMPSGQVRERQPDYPESRMVSPSMCSMTDVGKKIAGRVLDGRTWHEYPLAAA